MLRLVFIVLLAFVLAVAIATMLLNLHDTHKVIVNIYLLCHLAVALYFFVYDYLLYKFTQDCAVEFLQI